MDYPRDLVGYGRDAPHADWPGGARIAVQFVLNYEEGGENSVLHGDAASEQFLSEIIGAAAFPARHLSMESIYEYGSRAGVWRILREFERRKLPLTVFGVSMALERNPELTAAFVELGHEIACHGWRWIHYQDVDEATEREHMRIGVEIIRRMTGAAPLGWYTGRDSPNTRRLVVEHGGFLYDADYYGDDLPFWTRVRKSDGTDVPHLVVPYTLDCNDMRFATPQGFNTGEQFFTYLKDSVRRALRRGRRATEDDVHRHALPIAGTARTLRSGCSASSTTSSATTTCGCAGASTSRGIGCPAIRSHTDPRAAARGARTRHAQTGAAATSCRAAAGSPSRPPCRPALRPESCPGRCRRWRRS